MNSDLKVKMQASTSSRRGDHEQATVMCPKCNIEGMRKVSHSSQNPGKMHAKCLRCEKFLGWVDEANPNLERRLLRPLTTDVAWEVSEAIGWEATRLDCEAGLGLLVVGVEFVTSQPKPVTIYGKWPPLVFLTRRMPSKPRKLRQLHSIFHN
ncbi:hypothetical protein Cgig2_002708 [Carnegiea gigantea]|uniref:Uncharacterized protein n=1 Tax=Carnegiea gigantea TaxID=171969 RepID=A0A9Q1KNQ6_9CARY|nr:hypothetical protein Cgig2_002708 [Carnegiea gigantea]